MIAYNSNISLTRSITTVGSIYDLIIKYDLPNIDLIGFVLIIPKLFGSICSNCIMNSTHISFTLLENSSSLKIHNLTNPSSLTEFSLNVTILNNSYIAYSSSLYLRPLLSSIYFSGQSTISNSTTISENNITLRNLVDSDTNISILIALDTITNIT